jgi:hypothetical protein
VSNIENNSQGQINISVVSDDMSAPARIFAVEMAQGVDKANVNGAENAQVKKGLSEAKEKTVKASAEITAVPKKPDRFEAVLHGGVKNLTNNTIQQEAIHLAKSASAKIATGEMAQGADKANVNGADHAHVKKGLHEVKDKTAKASEEITVALEKLDHMEASLHNEVTGLSNNKTQLETRATDLEERALALRAEGKDQEAVQVENDARKIRHEITKIDKAIVKLDETIEDIKIARVELETGSEVLDELIAEVDEILVNIEDGQPLDVNDIETIEDVAVDALAAIQGSADTIETVANTIDLRADELDEISSTGGDALEGISDIVEMMRNGADSLRESAVVIMAIFVALTYILAQIFEFINDALRQSIEEREEREEEIQEEKRIEEDIQEEIEIAKQVLEMLLKNELRQEGGLHHNLAVGIT